MSTAAMSLEPDDDHHAVVSTFDLFSIGVGPSSSHTVGPMRAAKIFLEDLKKANVLDKVQIMKVHLYGSLALTGDGHGTPNAILMGLEGEAPESVDTQAMPGRCHKIAETSTLRLNGTHPIEFRPAKDLIFHPDASLPQHPNGMRFLAMDADAELIACNEYFSIGGGFVVNEKTRVAHGENVFYMEYDASNVEEGRKNQDVAVTTAALPFSNGLQLLEVCQREHMSIAQVVWENERRWRSVAEIRERTKAIWQVMDNSIENGCLAGENDILRGGLNIKRRAPKLYRKLLRGFYGGPKLGGISNDSSRTSASTTNTPVDMSTNRGFVSQYKKDGVELLKRRRKKRMVAPALDFLSAYAIAVNEENAAGGRVVTAPTNGAAGVIPSVLKYYLEFSSDEATSASPDYEALESDVIEFLFTAAAIGMLYKRGASISAAEMGCQGEVGVACSMAAAAFAAVMGGTVQQVENAAEIAMEHNLGLTCDPVGGLVQIPCIERNALGAVKAVTAAQLALNGDGEHHVSLDAVIETMRQTGHDMMSKYKETSLGGLAVNVPLC
ncbi:L-serine ammonia-lyase [Fimicolochytrium jonesii]|uniref:L-serine ammonia-lyase n=1 Tax=Fimicolochytrium jonesii TaxID=1396493 RepID=UPI0022FE2050|nr:L-serine ammonia-lyase [Fimicolochytrium jonesii]KAI8822101.1 L-serine ammonia-lyase [Fimicolochytrium jonesii]